MTKTQTVLSHQMMNADGSLSTVGAIVAEMQKDGFPQRFIDRWMQGVGLQLAKASRSMADNPHAVALGKLAKGKTSEAKAAAARENGKKGGRPKGKKRADR
jgi:hypothetical protein